jgi:hypothetical protein
MSSLPEREDFEWSGYRKLILSQLEKLSEASDHLNDKIDTNNLSVREKINDVVTALHADIAELQRRLSMLEVRAGIWGGFIGAATGLIASTTAGIVINYAMHAAHTTAALGVGLAASPF